MRFVIVNENGDECKATCYDTPEEMRAALRALLMEYLGEVTEDEVTAVIDHGDDALCVLTEGSTGVWTGFSSADRSMVGGPLDEKIDEDDFIGNGDPMFYLTVGQPSGEPVIGLDQSLDPSHPIYQAYIDAEDA